jgi:hypothetical protein
MPFKAHHQLSLILALVGMTKKEGLRHQWHGFAIN